MGKDSNVATSSHVQKYSDINAIKMMEKMNENGPEFNEITDYCSQDYTPKYSITEEKIASLLKNIHR